MPIVAKQHGEPEAAMVAALGGDQIEIIAAQREYRTISRSSPGGASKPAHCSPAKSCRRAIGFSLQGQPDNAWSRYKASANSP